MNNNQHQPFEFRVWDKPNKMFLKEFQTEYGQWVWGRREDLVGQSTWKWILDHPEDFTVCMYVGVEETDSVTKQKRKIFTGDIVCCWDQSAEEGVGKYHTGVIEFAPACFHLHVEGDIYLELWTSAENIKIEGNIFQNPEKAKDILLPALK